MVLGSGYEKTEESTQRTGPYSKNKLKWNYFGLMNQMEWKRNWEKKKSTSVNPKMDVIICLKCSLFSFISSIE